MQRDRTIALAGLFWPPSAILTAADATGKWKGQIEDADHETVFTLNLDGSDVTGTMTGAEGQDFHSRARSRARTFRSLWIPHARAVR
jgi:hypothetical protein